MKVVRTVLRRGGNISRYGESSLLIRLDPERDTLEVGEDQNEKNKI